MINELLAAGTVGQPTPEVGMGATILLYSDRHAATIVGVETKGRDTLVRVQYDESVRISGSAHDGTARYEFKPNPRAGILTFRAALPDGKWQEVHFNAETKRWNSCKNTRGLRIGDRDEYRDPHF